MDMLWYSEQQLGETRHRTPEGYLVCENVPIARLGPMLYARGEIPLTADSSGLIHVNRDEKEVFRPETLASFNGKPVVINHPPELVNYTSWKNHAVGHAMHVRRGTGDKANFMVADLLITAQEGIDAIERRGLRQISNGYQAKYRQISPGVGEQHSIVGNHIALVDNARCGPACAIGDSNDRVIELKGQQGMPTVAEQLTRALDAWKTNDKATLDQVMGEMNTGGSSGGPPGRPQDTLPNPADQSGQGQHRIIVNVHGGQPGAVAPVAGASPVTPAAGMAPPAAGGPPVQPVSGAVSPAAIGGGDIAGMLQQILALLTGDDDPEDPNELEEDDGGSDGGGSPPPPSSKTGDKAPTTPKTQEAPTTTTAAATTDSAGMEEHFQDVLARAEILAPGTQGATFDKAATPTATTDSLCAVMRRALTTAYTNDQSRALITPLLGGKKPEFDKLTCDSVTGLFMGASELKKRTNNAGAAATVDYSHTTNKPPTIKELNAKNAEFWKQNGNKH